LAWRFILEAIDGHGSLGRRLLGFPSVPGFQLCSFTLSHALMGGWRPTWFFFRQLLGDWLDSFVWQDWV
jgi:hypothetical protein